MVSLYGTLAHDIHQVENGGRRKKRKYRESIRYALNTKKEELTQRGSRECKTHAFLVDGSQR
jgi:hypothetical protein